MLVNSKMLLKKGLTKQTTRTFASTPNVVHIDFKDIMSQDKSVFDKFAEGFGDQGVGAVIVNNIPGFPEKRRNLLPYAQK